MKRQGHGKRRKEGEKEGRKEQAEAWKAGRKEGSVVPVWSIMHALLSVCGMYKAKLWCGSLSLALSVT